MSIATQIEALQQDKTNIASAITTKGGTVGSGDGFDDFATDIATIPTGITPTGNIALTATTSTQTGINVTQYATASVAPTPSESKTLTLGSGAPTAVNPSSGKLLSSVPVALDTSVIKADNIAEGVTMLGIAGTHSGGGGGSKYGATMDSFFNDLTSTGKYEPPTETGTEEMVFTGLKSLTLSDNYQHVFAYKFAYSPLKKVSFPDMTYIGCQNAFYYAFYHSLVEEFSCPVLTTFNLSRTFYYAFYYSSKLKKASFNALANANQTYMLYYAFAYAGVSDDDPLVVEFPALTTISGATALSNIFNHAYLGYGVLHPFPNLTTISANGCLTTAFYYTNCIRYVLDKITVLDKVNMFTAAWQGCYPGRAAYNETYGIMFPVLTTIGVSGSTSSHTTFKSCCIGSNSRMNAYFSSLTYIYNNHTSSGSGHFATCGLIKVFLPKLTEMGTHGEYAFYNSTTITEMHFGIENQAAIEAATGYSSKFGATKATLYYDLANHLTINGTVYDRDGSTDDCDNWYFGFTNGDTTYYINNYYGNVDDTAYIKSGDTYTASGYTVEAIA